MPASSDRALEIRAAEAADRPAVLELLSASLGWMPGEHFERFFAWKHDDNPFGPSPAWVAVDDEGVVGYRTFLRWEHEQADGRIHRAVRAVDTATHPRAQGLGIFSRLTLHALEELEAEGVEFVFNTPNDKSRPGYLKMGWTQVGRLPASVRIASPASALRMARAKVPAERQSAATDAGRPAADVLADPALPGLLESLAPEARLHTRRTADHLRWRYGFDPLAYRAVTASAQLRDGVALFRLRRRGPALECALCEVLVPPEEPSATRALLRAVARASGADYVIRIGGRPIEANGFLRLPGQGPILTWRGLGRSGPGAELDDWRLNLGDIEMF